MIYKAVEGKAKKKYGMSPSQKAQDLGQCGADLTAG